METEIRNLLDSDSPTSFYYWLSILTYFERHQDDLTLDEVRVLADASEKCRLYWNEDKEEEKQVYKNGKHETQIFFKKGLGINKHEVNPNIHAHLAVLEHRETERLAKLVAEMPRDTTDVKEWASRLAADLCKCGELEYGR